MDVQSNCKSVHMKHKLTVIHYSPVRRAHVVKKKCRRTIIVNP